MEGLFDSDPDCEGSWTTKVRDPLAVDQEVTAAHGYLG